MKNILEKYKELLEHPKGKAFLFFGFYALFFLFVIIFIQTVGHRDALLQEYEKGDQSLFNTANFLNGNFYYDYKITIDNVLHDYYGKMNLEEESFKYNNQDYYKNGNLYYLENNIVDNPFHFREFIELSSINNLMSSAMYFSKTEYEDGSLDYKFLISVNTINKLLYELDTDYDDEPCEIIIKVNDSGDISGITYFLDSYCKYSDKCNNLKIEASYELIGEVREIKRVNA